MPDPGPGKDVSSPNFQGLYLRTPMMMHSIDPGGRLVAVSDFWLETLGYRREEVLGRPLTDFFTAASRIYAEETALPQFFQVGMPARSADRSGLRKAVDEDFLKRLEFEGAARANEVRPCGEELTQLDVAQTHIVEGLEFLLDLGDGLEEGQRLLNSHA